MYGKSNMETYITICKVNSQWEFVVWLRKFKQGLCIDLEGWDGEGGGRGFHVWERMYARGGFLSMYGKTNTEL